MKKANVYIDEKILEKIGRLKLLIADITIDTMGTYYELQKSIIRYLVHEDFKIPEKLKE